MAAHKDKWFTVKRLSALIANERFRHAYNRLQVVDFSIKIGNKSILLFVPEVFSASVHHLSITNTSLRFLRSFHVLT